MESWRSNIPSKLIDLINISHVAVELFINRSQMTSKCGENKKVHTRRCRVFSWCCYHILTSFVIYYLTDARQHEIYFALYNNEKTFFISKYFNIRRKPAFATPLPILVETRKEPFDKIYCLYKMKQFHWLLVRSKELWGSRKITPLSNLTRPSLLVEFKLIEKAELNCKI